MVDIKKQTKTEQLNNALELLHFAFRNITAHPDKTLAKQNLSRVHHRILYFIARNSGCSINQLLEIMKISKQYLHKPLKTLIHKGLVEVVQDEKDRRIKRLSLSLSGKELEKALTSSQRELISDVFDNAGEAAEQGWRKVMQLLANAGEIDNNK